MTGTAAFFREMAPLLTANLLTLLFVYSLWAYSRVEKSKVYLWNALLVILLAMYGWYSWDVKAPPTIRQIVPQPSAAGASSASGNY
jgi:hypothetical protein